MDWAKTTAWGYKKHLSFGIWCNLYKRFYGTMAAGVLATQQARVSAAQSSRNISVPAPEGFIRTRLQWQLLPQPWDQTCLCILGWVLSHSQIRPSGRQGLGTSIPTRLNKHLKVTLFGRWLTITFTTRGLCTSTLPLVAIIWPLPRLEIRTTIPVWWPVAPWSIMMSTWRPPFPVIMPVSVTLMSISITPIMVSVGPMIPIMTVPLMTISIPISVSVPIVPVPVPMPLPVPLPVAVPVCLSLFLRRSPILRLPYLAPLLPGVFVLLRLIPEAQSSVTRSLEAVAEALLELVLQFLTGLL